MRIPIEKVPIEVRRRAARHLESIRGTPLAEGADEAQLGDEACEVYRPDVKGVAYWEIEIVRLKQSGGRHGAGRANTGTGFIILSAGRHDVPISHWSVDLNAPSRALEQQAKTSEAAGGPPGKVYKLDALAYALEDQTGKYLGHLGVFPPSITPTATAIAAGSRISTATAQAAKTADNDSKPAPLKLSGSGAKPTKFKGGPWKSWPEAKRAYAKTFAPHLKALAQRAVVGWGIEDVTKEFGEGIHAGETLVVPLLKPGRAKLSGDGANSVQLTQLDRTPPAIQLTGLDVEARGEQQFTAEIAYEDGTNESLLFFVVPKGTPSNEKPPVAHPIVDRPLEINRGG